jgi:cytochrome c6
MKIKMLFSAAVIALIVACGGGDGGSNELGASVFKTHCQLCHGADGKLGLNGAKDFTTSPLTLDERIDVITNGRNTMLSYENTLSKEEIEAVAKYTLSFKK